MATRSNRLVPARAIHPGEILREELRERGVKQKDFAQAIGVQATHLNEFIKGKRNLNEDLAMKLESQLGIPFKTWMSLHTAICMNARYWMKRGLKNDMLFNLKMRARTSLTFSLCINVWGFWCGLALKE